MFPWYYFSITLLHAVFVIFWAWRWRRDRFKASLVGQQEQHAYCASCGYDLTGRDVEGVEDVQASACPECGRRIQAKADVIIPKHLKRRISHRMFAFTLGSQVIVFLMMGAIFFNNYRNPSIYQATNAYLIQQVMQGGVTSTNSSAYFELSSRLRSGDLSSKQEQQLLAYALKVQADPTQPWEHELGEMIEAGRAKGVVTDADWRQYAAQPGVVQLRARQRIHPGDPVVLQLQSDDSKLRASYDFRSQMAPSSADAARIAIYPHSAGPDDLPIVTHEMRLSSYHASHFIPLRGDASELPPGKYKAVVELGIPQPDPLRTSTQPGVFTPHRLTASFEVFPADQPQIVAVKDPALAQALEQAMFNQLLQTGGTQVKHEQWGTHLSFSLKEPASPIAGSFVITTAADGFVNHSFFTFEPNVRGSHWHEQSIYLMDSVLQQSGNPAMPFDRFTLRLTPDPARLKKQIDGYRYLDDTLWLRHVPMGTPEP